MSIGYFFSTANDAVQSTAILVGGGFAYLKYVRGRIHYASLSLDIDPALVLIGGRRCLRVTTKITNSGTYHMLFDIRCTQRVAVRCMDAERWAAACGKPRVFWGDTPRVTVDQLVDANDLQDASTGLEPAESKSNSWVTPLPDGEWVAYRIVFRVKACKKMWRRVSEPLTWTTTKIVVEAASG